jgi:hypothetical protein
MAAFEKGFPHGGPLGLTNEQYLAVCQACEPLLPADRSAFLIALANLLGSETEIGDGTVARAARRGRRSLPLVGFSGGCQNSRCCESHLSALSSRA